MIVFIVILMYFTLSYFSRSEYLLMLVIITKSCLNVIVCDPKNKSKLRRLAYRNKHIKGVSTKADVLSITLHQNGINLTQTVSLTIMGSVLLLLELQQL